MERILAQGNEAIGWGAVLADCKAFFGYPITPQNEITEWFAREMPARGGVFVQSQSETGSINMLYGAASTGVRCLTSTSSVGWALMQEGMSHLANAQLPCVIVLVQRGGPGTGTTRHAQMDYLSATRGGGNGGYKNIVLAPAAVQENGDLVQLAFHLADKYRNPVVILTDGIIGQMAEPLELRKLDLPDSPYKDWAVAGKANHKDGKRRIVLSGWGQLAIEPYPTYLSLLEDLDKKYRFMEQEARFESYKAEDASLILVAYGYCARLAQEAVASAREEDKKVGMIRPVTLWPFPYKILKEHALRGAEFLVVEDSMGQLVDDVKIGIEGRAPVHFLGVFARHIPTDGGMILPHRVLEEINRLIQEK